MARIGLNTHIQGLTDKLIIRWLKASAPLAEVGRLPAKDFPYDGVDNLLGLDRVVYIVQWWRSDDGVSLDQLIKDWAIDASIYNETTINTYQYVVDRGDGDSGVWADPVDLDIDLIDTRLGDATQDELIVHEAGYGNHTNAEYDLIPGGGIQLLGGKTFDSGVAWFITRTQTVAAIVGPGDEGSNQFAGIAILAADRDFYVDATDNLYNKLVIANWATTVGQVTFGALALIPDHTRVTFQTERGLQNYLRLQFNPGDTVRFLNADVNLIDLAKCETISLYFFGGVCYVIDYRGRALQRGQVLNDYSATRADETLACLPADEATGVLDGADYPGLYAFILGLTTGVVPLGAGVGQWEYNSAGVYPNKRNYGLDAGAGTFRVPHLTGVVAKLGATSGVYEADNVGSFSGNLSITKGYSYTGAPNNTIFGNGANNPETKLMPFTYTPAITETRVKSVSQIPYIIL